MDMNEAIINKGHPILTPKNYAKKMRELRVIGEKIIIYQINAFLVMSLRCVTAKTSWIINAGNTGSRRSPKSGESGRRLASVRFCLHQLMRWRIRTMNNSKIDMKWRMVLLNERCPIEDCNRLTNSLDNGFLRAVITVLLRIMKFESVIHFQ